MLKNLIPILFVVFIGVLLFDTDDSDRTWWDRSGMRLMVDNRTGCHYFGGIFGSPIERRDRNGTQICDPR